MKLLNGISRRFFIPPEGDLTGVFDFSDDLITGWVVDRCDPSERDLTVSVVSGDEVVAHSHVDGPGEVGWRFGMSLGGRVDGSDVLHERIRVLVRDNSGRSRALRLEGSTQLQLIREYLSDPVTPLLEIDFRNGGNSDTFLRLGWSNQEKIHRWTEGAESAIVFQMSPIDHYCDLELLLWPFTVPGKLTEQRLEVLVNKTQLGRFSVTHKSFLRCRVPPSLLNCQPCVVIDFFHPDATSPARLNVSDDPRQLALAFRKLKILRAIE